MNWDEIKLKYPKSFNAYLFVVHSGYGGRPVNRGDKIWIRKNEDFTLDDYPISNRELYDFFDDHEIWVTPNITRWSRYANILEEDSERGNYKYGETYGIAYWGQIYTRADDRNAMNTIPVNSNTFDNLESSHSRSEWEQVAFTKAFEILENKL